MEIKINIKIFKIIMQVQQVMQKDSHSHTLDRTSRAKMRIVWEITLIIKLNVVTLLDRYTLEEKVVVAQLEEIEIVRVRIQLTCLSGNYQFTQVPGLFNRGWLRRTEKDNTIPRKMELKIFSIFR